jgi:NAD(P)-dependent dehydrogenase (short-subunit alcohol dehydrogenase family)
MSEICVITGGGSGMGLAAAKYMPKDKVIVVSGRTLTKLEKAVAEIEASGHKAYAHTCDTSDRNSVRELAEFCAGLGKITNVINAAGLSPAMAKQEQLIRVNALGTVYVNQEFSKKMEAGSVILDVSSNSAYVLPKFLINEKHYKLALKDEDKFVQKMIKKSNLAKTDYNKAGFAYALSKNFVLWYARYSAKEYGKRGIRVLSLSPGLIATDMGNLESDNAGDMVSQTAEKRMGTPEELGYAIATAVDERNGYLAGVDILCDGGATTLKNL